MEGADIFSDESNSERIISTFRSMLSKRLNNSLIMEHALDELHNGSRKKVISQGKVAKNLLEEVI
jgi:hypothetical protein